MPDYIVTSADSHTLEPADLWTKRIDRAYRDRAPHVIEGSFGGRTGEFFVCEELSPRAVGALAVAGTDFRDMEEKVQKGYAAIRPSGWDPGERLKDQDVDGIGCEVLYPSLGMGLYQLKDPQLQSATFRAYNDWVTDYVSAAPKRLVGVPLINLADIDEACRELARAKQNGLQGAMIWAAPPADRPYDMPLYEPFWTAAEELEMPVSMHILTGAEGGGGSIIRSPDRVAEYTLLHTMVCRTLTTLIMGGVLERHPNLKVVSVENDTGWLASYLGRLDHASRRYYQLRAPGVQDPVSQYFRRQVFATFQDDRAGVLTRELIGVDNLMWGSDFPHGDSTWPDSREALARNFAGVPEPDRRKITSENVRRLYNLN